MKNLHSMTKFLSWLRYCIKQNTRTVQNWLHQPKYVTTFSRTTITEATMLVIKIKRQTARKHNLTWYASQFSLDYQSFKNFKENFKRITL